MERLGVGLFSFSSGCAPSEDLELFRARLGEDGCRWLFRAIALDALLTVLAGFGECWISGEVAGCEGRRAFKPGVVGAEDKGVLKVLLDLAFETSCATV